MGEVSSWSFNILLDLVHDSRIPFRKESIGKADVVDGSKLCVEVLRRAEVARRVRVLMTESLVALLLEELDTR